MEKFKQNLEMLLREDDGQDMVEYGLIVGALGLGGIASMKNLAGSVASFFTGVGSSLTKSV